MSLLMQVERYIRKARVAPTRFGIDALGDPRLVFDLRRGRELRPRTAARVEAFMASNAGRETDNAQRQ